jgi:hypothetical protein
MLANRLNLILVILVTFSSASQGALVLNDLTPYSTDFNFLAQTGVTTWVWPAIENLIRAL